MFVLDECRKRGRRCQLAETRGAGCRGHRLTGQRSRLEIAMPPRSAQSTLAMARACRCSWCRALPWATLGADQFAPLASGPSNGPTGLSQESPEGRPAAWASMTWPARRLATWPISRPRSATIPTSSVVRESALIGAATKSPPAWVENPLREITLAMMLATPAPIVDSTRSRRLRTRFISTPTCGSLPGEAGGLTSSSPPEGAPARAAT
jgi:hypothetical protein